MNELSLVMLSVCMEAAIGIMFFLALARLKNKDIDGRRATIIAAVFTVIGVIGSITHLGRPMRALNALSNLGGSWLSRETLCVMLFAVCGAVCLAINLFKPAMKLALRVLEWVLVIIGLALLYVMGSIYDFASVPVWEGGNTYIEYYTSAVIVGVMFFFAATHKEQDRRSNTVLGAVALAALTIQIVSSELHTAALGGGSAAAVASLGLLRDMGALVAVKWTLLVVGIGAFCLNGTARMAAAPQLAAAQSGGSQTAAAGGGNPASGSGLAWASACLVLIAAFVGKVVFFASMVTTGIGNP